MTSTYTEHLSSHYPPKIRRRWRLLEILEDDRVCEIAGWDRETMDYLCAVLRVLCSEEPEVGRWPVLRLPLSKMPGRWWGEPRRVKRCEQRLVELGAIIPRGSRADLQPHWSDPATGMTYVASGIDLSPMDDLAAKLEAEAPKLVAAWKECYALHERLRRLNARTRRHIRAAVLDGTLTECQASEIRARLPKTPHVSEADAQEYRRLLRIAEAVETDFRQRDTTKTESNHDTA